MMAIHKSGLFERSLLLLLAAVAVVGHAAADETAFSLMREGGNVLLIRHATTVPGVGDPPEFRVEDCATQRNLSEAGREQSRRLGEKLRAAGVKVSEIRSSHWCRSLDTARLAFEPHVKVIPWQPLDSFFAGQGDRAAQLGAANARLAELPPGENWVWVTHQVNITGLTGEFTAMGEALIARPEGGRLRVIGRWLP